MAESLSVNFTAALNATLTNPSPLTSPSAVIAQLPATIQNLIQFTLASGTGAGKGNQMYLDTRDLNSTTEDINVYAPGVAGLDVFGVAFTIATVKLCIVLNNSATESQTLVLGNKAATSGWTTFLSPNTATMVVPGGGFVAFGDSGATGMIVGNSTTNHLLTVTNSAHFTYTIIIIGATA